MINTIIVWTARNMNIDRLMENMNMAPIHACEIFLKFWNPW